MSRFVTVGLLFLAIALVPTATAAQGNSEAAHACQQGGYANVVREDGTTFKNAGQCTSYVARGGTLVPAPPVITVAFRNTSDPIFCLIDVTLTRFLPNTTYTVQQIAGLLQSEAVVTTDAIGGATYTPFSFNVGPTFQASVDDITSGPITIAC